MFFLEVQSSGSSWRRTCRTPSHTFAKVPSGERRGGIDLGQIVGPDQHRTHVAYHDLIGSTTGEICDRWVPCSEVEDSGIF